MEATMTVRTTVFTHPMSKKQTYYITFEKDGIDYSINVGETTFTMINKMIEPAIEEPELPFDEIPINKVDESKADWKDTVEESTKKMEEAKVTKEIKQPPKKNAK